jgi:hypothetical protein
MMTVTYRVLVRKSKVNRPFGRPKHRGEDNIKMDFQEARWGRGWIDVARNRDK